MSGRHAHLGARGVEYLVGLGDLERAVRVPDPADRASFGVVHRPGQDVDRVGDQEAGQQPDTELTEELAPRVLQVVALAGRPDGGQQAPHLLVGQADAVVAEPERSTTFRGQDRDPTFVGGVDPAACLDDVTRVLQQFSDVDLLAAVEVMTEDVDNASQVDLELLPHRRLSCSLTGSEHRQPTDVRMSARQARRVRRPRLDNRHDANRPTRLQLLTIRAHWLGQCLVDGRQIRSA